MNEGAEVLRPSPGHGRTDESAGLDGTVEPEERRPVTRILRSFLVRHTGDNEDTHMGLF